MRYAKNIRDIINAFYYPSLIYGMAPYTRIKNKDAIAFESSPIKIKHIIHNGGIAFVVLLSCALRIQTEFEAGNLSFIDCVDGIMFASLQLATLYSMCMFIVRQNCFMSSIALMEEADNALREIGFTVSYKTAHRMLYIYFVAYPIYLITLAAPAWQIVAAIQLERGNNLALRKLATQFVNLAVTFVIRFVLVYHFTACLIIAEQMFRFLNQYLKDVESSGDRETVSRAIQTTKSIHHTLYQLIKDSNLAFGLGMFFHISLSFLEVVCAFVVLKYSHHVETFQVVVGGIFYGSTIFLVLIPCERVMNEAKITPRAVSELNLPYLDSELAYERKILLLQMLHERTELSAAGYYPLNMQVITLHVGVICTLLMFLLQLRDVLVRS